ncbi:TadE/TadG family type IV pilus assembly protein [Oricola cellulosilytica]|uniref:Pilus assembly protein n=1 Tax=Oricola cellulosilytica TaxID=1429082 RepID=A0A4R0PCE2_9HYPH|nr:TadE/TadG family type IV pilus assembly protein [Oricola cellulosilytica]TCD13848.1 pilus assembly protein [Oricola cellulosilytica]
MGKLPDRIRGFRQDRQGNFGVMFAVSATALLMAGGMAIDVSRMFSTELKLSQAVDAAVLATTQGLTLGDIKEKDADEKIRAYLDANLDGRNFDPSAVTIDAIVIDKATRTLTVDAHTQMPMTMTGIFGYDRQRVAVSSKAKYSQNAIEVAMALDVTGSMKNPISGTSTRKIDALKKAAKSGIATLLLDPALKDRVRVALAPYSAGVNATPVIDKIVTTTWSKGCAYERTGPEKYTDTFATAKAKIGSEAFARVGGRFPWDCPSAPIVPLEQSQAVLNSNIDALGTGGCTAGQVGVAWAQYLLSPKWNAAWPAKSQAAPYSGAGTSKYAIIMTDGAFNFHGTTSRFCDQTVKSERYAKRICDQMKANGINVYSIAFSAEVEAEMMMKECASTNTASNTYYYSATDEAGLEEAFVSIAEDIKGLRLVN